MMWSTTNSSLYDLYTTGPLLPDIGHPSPPFPYNLQSHAGLAEGCF